jgi:hypothetical protein
MAHVLAHIISKNGCQNNTPYNAQRRKNTDTFEWGKGTGQRVASGIFTFTHPSNAVQKAVQKKALHLL